MAAWVLDMPPGVGAASREGAGAEENSSGPAAVTTVGVRPGFGPESDRGASGAATREERAAARGARTGARAGTIVVVIASIVSGVSATTSGAGDKWHGKREGAGHFYRPEVATRHAA